MQLSNKQNKRSQWTTASQLAEMGFCERKIQLKHTLGSRKSPARQAAQRAGSEEHHHFLLAAFREEPTVVSSFGSPNFPSIGRTKAMWARVFDFIARTFMLTEGHGHDN